MFFYYYYVCSLIIEYSTTINNLTFEHNNADKNFIDSSDPNIFILESVPNSCLIQNSIEKLLATLCANPQIPRNVVQTIVVNMINIFDTVYQTLKNSTNKLLLESKMSNVSFNNFNNIF